MLAQPSVLGTQQRLEKGCRYLKKPDVPPGWSLATPMNTDSAFGMITPEEKLLLVQFDKSTQTETLGYGRLQALLRKN